MLCTTQQILIALNPARFNPQNRKSISLAPADPAAQGIRRPEMTIHPVMANINALEPALAIDHILKQINQYC